MEIALLINEYLKGKESQRTPDDHLNIVDNQIHTWEFPNIPQPTVEQLAQLEPIVAAELALQSDRDAKKDRGRKAREACQRCLDVIAGFNLDRALTAAQITQLQNTFGTIQTALMTNRPSSAKSLIAAITPDDVLVTQVMKDMALLELADF